MDARQVTPRLKKLIGEYRRAYKSERDPMHDRWTHSLAVNETDYWARRLADYVCRTAGRKRKP